MDIQVSMDSGRGHLAVTGDIDESGAEALKTRFYAMALKDLQEVVIDFSGVTLIGSAGIGKLLLFYKNLTVNGGALKLVNVPPEIYDMFCMLKLDTVFSIGMRPGASTA